MAMGWQRRSCTARHAAGLLIASLLWLSWGPSWEAQAAAAAAFSTSFSSAQYVDALKKSILFFEGQRSGKLPPNQRMSWRGDSGLNDGRSANVDLTGGYYDAGDNVKFGFPMAFSVTLLAWSAIHYQSSLSQAGELGNLRAAIRWGTDYFLKAHTAPTELYVQVANPYKDHSCWERAEGMDTDRTAYTISARNPGSDVAAETAAAMAAASVVFRRVDKLYANKLLAHAEQLFSFADRYRGAYSNGELGSVVCPFYCSYSGYNDELLWGAIWLYKASEKANYLQYVIQNGGNLGGTTVSMSSFNWDNKYAGVQVLAAQIYISGKSPQLKDYKSRADDYICSVMPGVWAETTTPGGMLWHQSGSNMQHVTSAAFLLTTYAKHAVGNHKVSCGWGRTLTAAQLQAFAKRQVDYILGSNPEKMSYMVGFGSRYPQHVHHRSASNPSLKSHTASIGCSDSFLYLNNGGADPNVLTGAVVGGPDQDDRYHDSRSDYAQTEPTTYINAPLVGALAWLAKPV